MTKEIPVTSSARSRRVIGAAACALLAGTPLFAQQSLTDQKTEAEIQKLEADTAKAKAEGMKVEIDTLNTLKSGVTGTATVKGVEQSAEGLMLANYLNRHVAGKIADHVVTWRGSSPAPEKPILIAFGTQPPTTAEYIALKASIGRLATSLPDAVDQWKAADPQFASDVRSLTAEELRRLNETVDRTKFMSAIVPIATLANVALSALKVTTDFSGVAMPVTESQFRPALMSALRGKSLNPEELRRVAGSPAKVAEMLKPLEPPHELARAAYRDYLTELAAKKGKVDDLGKAKADAGARLAAVLAEYDALQKALFTPVAGVLPAAAIEEQAALAEASDKYPILYVFDQKGALTTMTRQGLLTGIGGVPAFVSAASTVQFGYIEKGSMTHSLACVTPLLRITNVQRWIADAGKRADGTAGRGAAPEAACH